VTDLQENAQELRKGRFAALEAWEQPTLGLDSFKEREREAEGPVGTVRPAAVSAGWTARELRRLGFTQPATKGGGRSQGWGARNVARREAGRMTFQLARA